MKKLHLYLIAILLLSAVNLFSQDFAKKGIWEIGGNISLSNTTEVRNGEASENSLSVFNLETPIRYFVIDGLALGIVPSFHSISYNDWSATGFGIYFAPSWNFEINDIVYPFIEGRVGYNSRNDDDVRGGMAWAVVGGIKVQVGNSALVGMGLSYSQTTLEKDNHEGDRNGENILYLNVGFAIFLGD